MFIKSRIREYDIEECNISILRKHKIISDSEFLVLQKSKERRLIFVGNLIKEDPNIYKIISAETDKAIKAFIELNNINLASISEICFDALWIMGGKLITTRKINGLNIRCKREYTSLLEIGKMKFYYNSLTGELETRYVGKGIKDDKPLLLIIKSVMGLLESGDSISAYKIIHNYNSSQKAYNQFIHDMLNELNI